MNSDMVKVCTDRFKKADHKYINSDGFYLDGFLKGYLDHQHKNVTKKNFDAFIVVSGREGFGKSTLAIQMATYLDPTFNLNRVVFTAEQFLYAVENSDKYTAIVFDETMGYLGSRGAMSKFNRILVKVMSEMRSKNLFVFLCIPSFFELDKYAAMHRSTGLVYVRRRGVFGLYDYPKKKQLYIKGKKEYAYNVPPQLVGSFTSFFPLPDKPYEAKKSEAIKEWASNTRIDSTYKLHRDKLIALIINENIMKAKELGELLSLSAMQIGRIVKGFANSPD